MRVLRDNYKLPPLLLLSFPFLAWTGHRPFPLSLDPLPSQVNPLESLLEPIYALDRMPLSSSSTSGSSDETMDYRAAIDVLHQQFKSDGLDAKSLLDSDKRGGLT